MNRALVVVGLSFALIVTAASTASARGHKRHKKSKVQVVVHTAPVAKRAMPHYNKRGPDWRNTQRHDRQKYRRGHHRGSYQQAQQARYQRKMTRKANRQKLSLISKVNRKCERLAYRLSRPAARQACRSRIRNAMSRHNNSRLGAWAPMAWTEFNGLPRRNAQVVYYR